MIWILMGLVIANAFFSVAEFSIASSRSARLKQWAHDPEHPFHSQAQQVLDLQHQPSRFITVVQIALNIITMISGMVGEEYFAPWFEMPFQWVGMPSSTAHSLAVALSILAVTSLFIVGAELIPKKLTFLKPEEWACRCIGPLLLCFKILKPLVIIYSGIANSILRLLGKEASSREHITFEDVQATLQEGSETGAVDHQEMHLIDNVFSLADRTVFSAMTPKESIIFLDLQDSSEQLEHKILQHTHARFVVCEGGLHHWLGYIPSAALLRAMIHQHSFSWNSKDRLKEQGMMPLLAIPDMLSLKDVLDQFRAQRQDIAIVLNEFGEVVGLITLNDVLSTLMGDQGLQEDSLIVQRSENSWLVDGKTPLIDVVKLLGWSMEPSLEPFQTISGLLMFHLKCIPKKAQSLDFRGFHFEIVDIDHHRIDEVMITRLAESPPPPEL